MKKFFQSQREIIALIMYVAIIAGLVYLVIFPLVEKIYSIQDQVQEEEMKQEIARKNINGLPKIQKQYETLKASGDFTDVLLNKDEAVVLIEQLEKIAQQTNNSISIVAKEQPTVESKKVASKSKAVEVNIADELPSSDYLQLKITLNGKYDSIVKFVKAIENFEYYCDIIEIQISNNEKEVTERSTNGVADTGFSNPFVGSSDVVAGKTESGNDQLSATLDTVFYTRKK